MAVQVQKGGNRIVFIFPLVRIVIKLPIIYLVAGIHTLLYELKEGCLWSHWRDYTVEHYGTLKRLLCKGIVDNWREFQFYTKTHHPFLQPSYFSFLGLINVQRLGQPCTIKSTDLWCQLYELTQGAVFKNSHCFANPDNFCFQDGSIRIFDYGDPRTQEVIREFGAKIMKDFDPRYSWEERKKQLKREKESSV